jgi:hypothetical protein
MIFKIIKVISLHDKKAYEKVDVHFCSLLTFAPDGVNFWLHSPAILRPGRKSRYHLSYVRLENFVAHKGWICEVHVFRAMSFFLGFCLEASASNFDRNSSTLHFCDYYGLLSDNCESKPILITRIFIIINFLNINKICTSFIYLYEFCS